MFRRRTDQVYSTLQQVQRRITEQTGVSSLPGDEAKTEVIQPSPGVQSLSPQGATQIPQQVSLQPLSQALPQTRGAGLPPPLGPLPSSGRRYVLQLSGDLAMLLMVAWLASMAVMFVLGKNWHGAPGAGLAPGLPGNRTVSESPEAPPSAVPSHRIGDYVLVLQSSPTATADIENYFKGRAKELNDYVLRNPSHGWKQYFGVRKPSSGGVQLVFGDVDGQYGISRDDYLTFAALLAKPTKDGGAGYASSTWVRVDGP